VETTDELIDLSQEPTMYPIVEDSSEAGKAAAAGYQLARCGQLAGAEVSYRRAIELQPGNVTAYHNLGWLLQAQGFTEEAIRCYRRAREIDPSVRRSRRNLAILLVQLACRDECFALWHEEVFYCPESLDGIAGMVTAAMMSGDLNLAVEYAWVYARLRWGTPWYPRDRNGRSFPLLPAPAAMLTIPKLRHDIEQIQYLQRKAVLGDEFTAIINEYERIVERLTPFDSKARTPLAGDEARRVGHVYNRIIHIRDTPRVAKALSNAWDGSTVEDQYLSNPPGVVVVDNFLSEQALKSLRLFCLESTIWSTNRYAHGRLGSFFRDGFNCPLLIQIAQELRDTLPRVIGSKYPLRQLWGFKYGSTLPSNTVHADFAAVNVNFWITPDGANLDPSSGGLVVFDVEAPLDWDFATYNRNGALINDFLQRENARAINIPYRENRAVIFNSDLFHATDSLEFRSGYENRRINITMLYGDRENALHRAGHPTATGSH
jgi:hypothetical protein